MMRRMTTVYGFLLILTGALLIGGCAAGTHTDPVSMAEQDRADVPEWSALDDGVSATILGDLIRSRELGSLVNEALDANPGLRQTLLTLRIRQAENKEATGERLPEVSAGFEGSREKDNDAAYTGSLSVSWELDLWGKLADQAKAASLDVEEQAALYQSAQDTLAAEVMKAWVGLIAASRNIEIEKRQVAVLEKNETFIRDRYQSGLGTLEDLDSARSQTASARASLEAYNETLGQSMRSLNNLLGRNPESGEIDVPETYAAVLVPLADLPEQTLKRRPDMKAAYLALSAADLRTRVAYKDLLPSISLEAALADTDTSPSAALFIDPIWSLLGQLTAPLFQGGRLRAAAEIAELETAQSYEAYRETLQNAVLEIADAISLEKSLVRQQAHVETALASAQNNLRLYQEKYRAGLADILDLLGVQEQTFDLEIQANNLIEERLVNRIDLGLALGLGVKE